MSSFKSSQLSKAKPQLDLKALNSFSPAWTPALRYTTCIAARYAAFESVKNAQEQVDSLEQNKQASPTASEQDKTEHFEEEGEEDASEGPGKRQRWVEYVKDWQDFAQKFTTATCHHLGVAEETLPPTDVNEEDVLQAAKGEFKPTEPEKSAEELVGGLKLDDIGDIRQRVGGALEDGQNVEVVHELLLVAFGLGQYRAVDGTTTLFEQDMLFGALPEDSPIGIQSGFEKPPTQPQGPSCSARKSTESAVADADTKEYELPPPPPHTKDAVDNMSEAGTKAWGALSKGALASWNTLTTGVTAGVNEAKKAVGRLDVPSGGPSDGSVSQTHQEIASEDRKAKPKAPTKPNEICHYDARARAVIFRACKAMGMAGIDVYQGEKALAQSIFFLLQEGRKAATNQDQGADPLQSLPRDNPRGAWMNTVSAHTVDREKRKANWAQWAATGMGFAIGGSIIGLTGGLAAPLVAPALVGLTGLSFLATTSGIVLMGTLLGLGGGGLAGYRVRQRLRGLDSFEFVELRNQAREAGLAIPSLHATICVAGLLLKEEDQVNPWADTFERTVDSRDIYAVKTETHMMVEAGVGLRGYVLDQLMRAGGARAAEQIIKHTVLAGLTALTLPIAVFNAASAALDGVFVRAKTKAHKAGLVLAETLRKEVQGHRPVILVGSSLGCTTVLAALVELAKTPSETAHLVDSVFLINGPMTPSPSTIRQARSIVGRRFVNAYSSNDMVCAIAAWLGSGISLEEMRNGQLPRVAGSGPLLGISNVENIDISDLISSHFELCDATTLEQVIKRCQAFQD
ncbi:DUF726-domain-containing protein [Tilletiaria anomala UBC 951]|uniref:DUF726-domain-containing protein n=1 Tax=Tilletiaria anomala (strain ATCC 24038 / CBS 436.72 / UBC 951) TaxID=1037660 RepID=A0A066WFX5_TILAU|nr:DUF726-domain-containing protein [Tilletiaria anomala UBC 951]KDN51418.1 DUF726-domain-containing protein [Tilletiaria anomala UBC 951]